MIDLFYIRTLSVTPASSMKIGVGQRRQQHRQWHLRRLRRRWYQMRLAVTDGGWCLPASMVSLWRAGGMIMGPSQKEKWGSHFFPESTVMFSCTLMFTSYTCIILCVWACLFLLHTLPYVLTASPLCFDFVFLACLYVTRCTPHYCCTYFTQISHWQNTFNIPISPIFSNLVLPFFLIKIHISHTPFSLKINKIKTN